MKLYWLWFSVFCWYAGRWQTNSVLRRFWSEYPISPFTPSERMIIGRGERPLGDGSCPVDLFPRFSFPSTSRWWPTAICTVMKNILSIGSILVLRLFLAVCKISSRDAKKFIRNILVQSQRVTPLSSWPRSEIWASIYILSRDSFEVMTLIYPCLHITEDTQTTSLSFFSNFKNNFDHVEIFVTEYEVVWCILTRYWSQSFRQSLEQKRICPVRTQHDADNRSSYFTTPTIRIVISIFESPYRGNLWGRNMSMRHTTTAAVVVV